MADDLFRGLAEAEALIDKLPNAAEREMARDLAAIASDILAAQQAAVPTDTGNLKGGLAAQLLLDQLRVKVGLISLKGGRRGLYYGRFVEFGVRAQTVTVERRRRVNGKLRTLNRRKRAEDIVTRYALRVKPQAPREFIGVGDAALNAKIDARLADFWSRSIDDAGGAA